MCAWVGTRNADCTRSRSTRSRNASGSQDAQHGHRAAGEDRRVAEREAGAVVHRRHRGRDPPGPSPHSRRGHVERQRPAPVGDQHALGASRSCRRCRRCRTGPARRPPTIGSAADAAASASSYDGPSCVPSRDSVTSRASATASPTTAASASSRTRAGRAAVVEDVAGLGRGQPRVERHHHQAGLGDAGGDLRVLQPVAEQHGHPVARPQPVLQEVAGEPGRALVERGEGQAAVPVDHRGGGGGGAGELADAADDRQRGATGSEGHQASWAGWSGRPDGGNQPARPSMAGACARPSRSLIQVPVSATRAASTPVSRPELCSR